MLSDRLAEIDHEPSGFPEAVLVGKRRRVLPVGDVYGLVLTDPVQCASRNVVGPGGPRRDEHRRSQQRPKKLHRR